MMGLVWGFWGAPAILPVLVRSFPHLSDRAWCWAFAFWGEVGRGEVFHGRGWRQFLHLHRLSFSLFMPRSTSRLSGKFCSAIWAETIRRGGGQGLAECALVLSS